MLGTSIHGVFDSAAFRRRFIDAVRESKGLAVLGEDVGADANISRRLALDRLAEMFEANVDLRRIAALAGLSWKV